MRIALRRAVLLLILLLSLPARIFSSEALSLVEFGKKYQTQVSFDPLTACGQLEQRGVFVSFAPEKPYMILDWQTLRKVEAPYWDKGALMLPAGFVDEASKYFSEKNAPKKEAYSVATILIDAGHGGKDSGAVATINGTRLMEKTLTLEVSRRVADLLRSRYPERKIITTRDDDSFPSLEDRVAMANSAGLGMKETVIYVSIHANASFNKNAKGFEVWYLNPEYRRTVVDAETVREKGSDIAPILNAMLEEEFTTESIILARKVYDRLGTSIGTSSPGRGIRAEEWFVVRNAKMPSILIEMGFITHPEEGKLLSSSAYLRKIGDAIYNGIVDFIEHFET
ncbi:MAG: N-acetylmuramoyl-L-alanine amidase [Spirochaetia bacterium]|jgi:N-acetylmuramoyl-L-alanine amidase|nr:N-acetylmuramoyl-L-alanine amidase [Spirochaetia bacterium]